MEDGEDDGEADVEGASGPSRRRGGPGRRRAAKVGIATATASSASAVSADPFGGQDLSFGSGDFGGFSSGASPGAQMAIPAPEPVSADSADPFGG